MKTHLSRLFSLMLCILPLLTFTACDFINGLRNLPGTEGGQFTAYRNQVTKDEFQKQYAQAFNSLQPDYTKDFVYTYTNDSKEIHKTVKTSKPPTHALNMMRTARSSSIIIDSKITTRVIPLTKAIFGNTGKKTACSGSMTAVQTTPKPAPLVLQNFGSLPTVRFR